MTSPNQETMNHSKSNQSLLQEVFDASGLDQKGLAQYLGTSYFSVVRWERGDIEPGADVVKQLHLLLADVKAGRAIDLASLNANRTFASRGIRKASTAQGYDGAVELRGEPGPYLLSRLRRGALWGNGEQQLTEILSAHAGAAQTVEDAVA